MPDTEQDIFIQQAMALVQRSCLRILGDPEQADDAAQAVFLVYWRRRRQVAVHPQPLAWFQRTAVLVCRQAKRGERRRRFHERQAAQLGDRVGDEVDQVSRAEQALQVEQALAELAPRYAEVLQRSFFLEQTQQTIAQQLQVPLGTVASWIRRGQASLERILRRRGVSLGGGLVVSLMGPGAASAAVPVSLPSAGGISLDATQLAEGALRAMAWAKAKLVLTAATILLMVGGGIGVGAVALDGQPAPVSPKQVAEAVPEQVVPPPVQRSPAWSDPQARAMLAFLDPDQPLQLAIDTRQTVDLLARHKPLSIWSDPDFAEQRRGWERVWEQLRWWESDLAPMQAAVEQGGAMVMAMSTDVVPDTSAGRWHSRFSVSLVHDAGPAAGDWRQWLGSWDAHRRDLSRHEHPSGFGGMTQGPITDRSRNLILWRDDLFVIGQGIEVLRSLEAGAGLRDAAPETPVFLKVEVASLLEQLEQPPFADLIHLLRDEYGRPLSFVASLAAEEGGLQGSFVLGPLQIPLQAPRQEAMERLNGDADLVLAMAIDPAGDWHPLLRTFWDFLAYEAGRLGPMAMDAWSQRYLRPLNGEILLSVDWRAASLFPADVRCLVAHRDLTAIRALIEEAAAGGLPVRAVSPAAGIQHQWHMDVGGWQLHIGLNREWLALSQKPDQLSDLMAPLVGAERVQSALTLRADIPSMLRSAEPYWPLLHGLLAQDPIRLSRRANYSFGRFLSHVRKQLEGGADVSSPEDMVQSFRSRGSSRHAQVSWLPLFEEHGDQAFSIYAAGERGSRREQLCLVLKNSAGFEVFARHWPRSRVFEDQEAVAAMLQETHAQRICGPELTALADIGLPGEAVVHAGLLPSVALLHRHLPVYELSLQSGTGGWSVREEGLPLAVLTLGALVSTLQGGEFRSLADTVWVRQQEAGWHRVADKHEARIDILRKAADGLRQRLQIALQGEKRTARSRRLDLLPRAPTDLLDWAILTPADLVELAGRPLDDRPAQAQVGRMDVYAGADPEYALRAPRFSSEQLQRLAQRGSYRMWSVPLEQDWYAVMTNPGLDVVVIYLPFDLQPTDHQRSVADPGFDF